MMLALASFANHPPHPPVICLAAKLARRGSTRGERQRAAAKAKECGTCGKSISISLVPTGCSSIRKVGESCYRPVICFPVLKWYQTAPPKWCPTAAKQASQPGSAWVWGGLGGGLGRIRAGRPGKRSVRPLGFGRWERPLKPAWRASLFGSADGSLCMARRDCGQLTTKTATSQKEPQVQCSL